MKSSIGTFLLYIGGKIIQTIVDHTNIEGAREKESKRKDTDTVEKMKSFIWYLLHTWDIRQNYISV